MNEKQIAAEKAIEFIQSGMILGLGTGSTINFFLKKLGEQIKKGLNITGVSSSNSTTSLALSYNIPLISINEVEEIDLTLDGADEVDKHFNGIKGGGGALLYEKLIASISKKNIWIIDSSKLVNTLGKFPLPLEIVSFGYKHTLLKLKQAGFNASLRMRNGEIFQSDGGNYIVDLIMNKIAYPEKLYKEIKLINGVIENGLFINTPDLVLVSSEDGVKVLENNSRTS
ncbi:MAG: ribose 5-phosphate isomerase A [Ignavibacteria bacterium RBG_16_34_14]|nr:MAG: ribose 5-phosphate isomerase A [Ignavibacteria bacterium RBG_16_34_14]